MRLNPSPKSREKIPCPIPERKSKLSICLDCLVTCDPNLNGDGCNSGLQAVGQKFQQDIENPIDSCYSCYYKQEAKGEVAGNPNCWNDAVETNIRSNQCTLILFISNLFSNFRRFLKNY